MRKMKFINTYFIAIIFLSGCSPFPIETKTVESFIALESPSQIDSDSSLKTSEIEGYTVDELTEPESLYFDGNNLKSAEFSEKIYRSFIPNKTATIESLESELRILLTNKEDTLRKNILRTSIGDCLCPMLYSPNICAAPISELESIFLDVGIEATIIELKENDFTIRLYSLALSYLDTDPTSNECLIDLDKAFFTFLQVCTDKDIFVQPLFEKSRDNIRNIIHIADNCGKQFLILEGTRQENRYSNIYTIFTFTFDNGYWKPCSPDLIDNSLIKNSLDKYSDIHLALDGFWASKKAGEGGQGDG